MIEISFPLTKKFQMGKQIVFCKPSLNISNELLDKVQIESGYLYGLYGNNGTGKTTLMNILSLLTDSESDVNIKGNNLFYGLDSSESNQLNWSKTRSEFFSFIFQDAHLVNIYTIQENIAVVNPNLNFLDDVLHIINEIESSDYDGATKKQLISKFNKFMSEKNNSPFYLSGGEKQLLSFFRSMIKPSNIIFVDEPWASMDKHMKNFIESQLYLYLNDEDMFSSIRNRYSNLLKKKIVMVISHPVHHKESENNYVIQDNWTKNIPVTKDDETITKDTQQLKLIRYTNEK